MLGSILGSPWFGKLSYKLKGLMILRVKAPKKALLGFRV